MHDVKTYTEKPCMVNIRNFNKPDLVAIVYILEIVALFSLRKINSFRLFE